MPARQASRQGDTTIRSSREIQRLFESSKRSATPLLIALIASTPEGRGPQGRVAFVAGKRLGGAVVRNRSKRVMREAARRQGGPWAGRDIVLIAREGTAQAKATDLDSALRSALERAGIA